MTTIAQVEAWPVNVPLVATYLMAPGVYPGMSRTVVRVTTADGLTGLGETPSARDAERLARLTPTLLGRDAEELRTELGQRALPAGATRAGAKVVTPNALAGIEIALWDIAGQARGQPVYELLGGAAHREIPFTEYFAYRVGHEETPEAVAAYCERMAEAHDSPWFEGKLGVRPPAEDLRLAAAVREAIGPRRTLRLDANMAWRVPTARRMLTALAEHDIANMEEPASSFAELAALRRTSAIPFSAHTPDVDTAARLGVPETLVVGLGACGGIAGTRRFVESCREAGVGFWFYSGDLGIATAAQLHVTAATEGLDRPSQSLLRWYADDVIAQGPFAPSQGVVAVPEGPGLGVTLDERALARGVERYAREGEYHLYSAPPLPHY